MHIHSFFFYPTRPEHYHDTPTTPLYGSTAALASSAIAGCSSVLGGPVYEDVSYDELLFDQPNDDWPDDDLVADHDFNTNFDRCYITPEEDLFIFMSVNVYEEVEQAEEQYQRMEATGANSQEYPLADEAYVGDDGEAASVGFRHSNAIADVFAAGISGFELTPDRNRATRYAELLFEHWQSQVDS